MPTSRTTVKVLLLRHGEREDEIARKQDPVTYQNYKKKRTNQDRFDPNLTLQGLLQAKMAFDNILHSFTTNGMKKRRVALFTSPLRRTIGTSLMISATTDTTTTDKRRGEEDESSLEQMVEWGFTDRTTTNSLSSATAPCCTKAEDGPEEKPQQQQQHKKAEDVVVPIMVMNGLGDCAAAVRSVGGAHHAVESGMIACASVLANDYGGGFDDSSSTPIMKEIVNIQQRAVKAIDDSIEKETKTTTTTTTRAASDTAASSIIADKKELTNNRNKRLVQFLHGNLESNNPMSRRISYNTSIVVSPDEISPISHNNKKGSTNKVNKFFSMSLYKDVYYKESFHETLDRCVKLAIHDHCDTMIVICHREGIRDLVERCFRGGQKPTTKKNTPRFHTPYCCIGTFTATAIMVDNDDDDVSNNEDDEVEVHWRFERVTKFEDFYIP